MNDNVLLELANRWRDDASNLNDTGVVDLKTLGHREAKRECADTLRMLVSILGSKHNTPEDRFPVVEKRRDKYKCGRCGCIWVNNGDGTCSLMDGNERSCSWCESRGLEVLQKVIS